MHSVSMVPFAICPASSKDPSRNRCDVEMGTSSGQMGEPKVGWPKQCITPLMNLSILIYFVG